MNYVTEGSLFMYCNIEMDASCQELQPNFNDSIFLTINMVIPDILEDS